MSNLEKELELIRKNIAKTSDRMGRIAQDFEREGGICCPSCWSEEYSILLTKQRNRDERIRQIRTKLKKK